jgi:hypothetical protein
MLQSWKTGLLLKTQKGLEPEKSQFRIWTECKTIKRRKTGMIERNCQ